MIELFTCSQVTQEKQTKKVVEHNISSDTLKEELLQGTQHIQRNSLNSKEMLFVTIYCQLIMKSKLYTRRSQFEKTKQLLQNKIKS